MPPPHRNILSFSFFVWLGFTLTAFMQGKNEPRNKKRQAAGAAAAAEAVDNSDDVSTAKQSRSLNWDVSMMSPNELWVNPKQAWPFAGGWTEPRLSILTWLKWNWIIKKKFFFSSSHGKVGATAGSGRAYWLGWLKTPCWFGSACRLSLCVWDPARRHNDRPKISNKSGHSLAGWALEPGRTWMDTSKTLDVVCVEKRTRRVVSGWRWKLWGGRKWLLCHVSLVTMDGFLKGTFFFSILKK